MGAPGVEIRSVTTTNREPHADVFLDGAKVSAAAEYTSGREQFGRPIGSFQAAQQRMADGFIDLEAIRWTQRFSSPRHVGPSPPRSTSTRKRSSCC
jgi:3-oxocholest-4-en-26-oyl-CoA dehydrogenase beta subunit